MSAQSAIFNPTLTTSAASGSGFSVPRLTTTGRLAIAFGIGDSGMMVYDTTLNNLFIWTGSAWESVPASGDAGINGAVQYNDNGVVSGATNFVYNKVNQKVGIGTITPNVELDVVGNAAITGDLTVSTAARFNGGATAGFLNGSLLFGSSGGFLNLYSAATGFNLKDNTGAFNIISTTNAGVFTFGDGAGGTRMTLNSTGLGVGVTPSARLHIQNTGDVYARIATTTVSKAGVQLSANGVVRSHLLYDDAAGTTYLSSGAVFGGSGQGIVIQSGTTLNFFTNNQLATAQMILDTSGNLLVGVASSSNRLDIQKSTDCTLLVKSTGANANIVMDYVSNYGNNTIRKSGTAVWDYGVINDSSATPAFKIGNGSSIGVQLVSGATAWTTLSDETMKDIIEPISNAVAKVGLLRSVIGKFKTDVSSKRRSFLIAQDVKSVLPEAVDVIGVNNELGLRYTEVVPLLVAAIKELTARVQTLEAR